jgi:hypothetical protein
MTRQIKYELDHVDYSAWYGLKFRVLGPVIISPELVRKYRLYKLLVKVKK